MPRKVLRPTQYQCPTCRRWYGEHMNTGLLARHKALGPDPLTLCGGSYEHITKLPVRGGGTPLTPPPRQEQLPLFP